MSYNDIISVTINEDGNLFAACLETGLRVFNVEPLVGKMTLPSSKIGSVSMCKLLHRTNLIALVGGGQRPKYADNTVLVWDDYTKKFVLEFTFATKVLSLCTRRDRLFAVERNKIHCFNFPNDPYKLFTIETRDNPTGIIAITPYTSASECEVLAYPGHRLGSVQLVDLTSATSGINPSSRQQMMSGDGHDGVTNLPASKTSSSVSIAPTNVPAHQTDIACVALNRSGTLLATASKKGTLIRIFRTISRESSSSVGAVANGSSKYNPLAPVKIAEFRRGMDTAMVHCIQFSPDSEYVLVSSDKGTVHIFALKETNLNRRSTFSAVPFVGVGVGMYTDSQWALAKFTVTAECACVCTFGPVSLRKQSVYAICVDGTFHKYYFTQDGQCERDNFDNFLDVPEAEDHILL